MQSLKQRAKKIKMLILDIDGVMTDGRIIYDSKGNELKCFNVLDGMGLALLSQTKIKVALITAKGSKAVLRRARDINAVDVRQNTIDKFSAFTQILKKHKLNKQDVCFVGDDLVDVPVMRRVGLAASVPNACSEARSAAHYVTKKEGGKGAVREVIEIILRAQGRWNRLVRQYLVLICAMCLIATGCARENNAQAKSPEPKPEELSSSEKELIEAPDEMLSSFSISGRGKGGQKQWELEGKSADIMAEEIKLTDVTGRVYGKTNMTIIADEGSLNRINNSVHLEKNVVATTDDGATMNTDYLDWDAQEEKLTSDAPVWIKRGMMQAWGEGLISQPVLKLVQLNKDVSVTLTLQGNNDSSTQQDADTPKEQTATTVITCNGPLEVDYQNNLAIFYDNAKVKDERGEIFADRMDVYFTTEAEEGKQLQGMEGMGIEKIIATGNTEIHHGGNITYSQKAVYDTNTGKLTLTGQPKLVIYSTEAFSQAMRSPE